ncbi:hypothetical protein BGZ61DRAFT_457815 [Ilyonectria robusta]|uniref:uncharacterized protein n=1 Tax=Ilyonectria robusta TaxID=1079257 RepID=UPI001E8D1E6E|nr:uncharacterized protein BGZ61DRAFT_457815 [Ilyonectria robusta]KAH8677209.1 hypothetical protein BGZ61DRAFT_457815 [Ilyonectria robusta]
MEELRKCSCLASGDRGAAGVASAHCTYPTFGDRFDFHPSNCHLVACPSYALESLLHQCTSPLSHGRLRPTHLSFPPFHHYLQIRTIHPRHQLRNALWWCRWLFKPGSIPSSSMALASLPFFHPSFLHSPCNLKSADHQRSPGASPYPHAAAWNERFENGPAHGIPPNPC